MAGLSPWQQELHHVTRRRRVHPAVLVTRSTKRFRSHPPLRIHGQPPTKRLVRSLPPTSRCRTRRRTEPNRVGLLLVLSSLSGTNDSHPTLHRSATSEAHVPMRYVLIRLHNPNTDVCFRLVRAGVCLYPKIPLDPVLPTHQSAYPDAFPLTPSTRSSTSGPVPHPLTGSRSGPVPLLSP